MTSIQDERLMRAAFATARTLEPSEQEIAAVLSRSTAASRPGRAGRRTWARPALAAAVVLVALAAGGYAVAPPVRAALDGVANNFDSWLGGDASQAPGRPLATVDQAPDYFRDPRYTDDPRVIAEAGAYKLFAAREPGGRGVEFDLGNTGVGIGLVLPDSFDDQALMVLGPGAMNGHYTDSRGHVPLFGISARSVRSVELTYDDGPPLRVATPSGGFVLLAQPERSPRAVVALDANGEELGRALVDDSQHDGPRIDWTQYRPPPAAPRAGSR